MSVTKAKLERFIKVRNKSMFSSNLQFQIDLDECGLTLADIGQAVRRDEGAGGFMWATPCGKLIEERGELRLEPYED